jgi:CheY-like chemotaxis protein
VETARGSDILLNERAGSLSSGRVPVRRSYCHFADYGEGRGFSNNRRVHWVNLPMHGNAQIRNVLIIDDEACVADTLAAIFSTRGYKAWVAYSAEKAIEIIAEWPPDLAVVDVMLPQMNGIDFSIILLDNYPACRILLFSGQPDTSAILEDALKKGHNFEVLAKPVHPTLILDMVEGVVSTGQERMPGA